MVIIFIFRKKSDEIGLKDTVFNNMCKADVLLHLTDNNYLILLTKSGSYYGMNINIVSMHNSKYHYLATL